MQNGRRKKKPEGPRGEKRPADAIGLAVVIGKIATGEIENERDDAKSAAAMPNAARYSQCSAKLRRCAQTAALQTFRSTPFPSCSLKLAKLASAGIANTIERAISRYPVDLILVRHHGANMGVNFDKPLLWKQDVAASVDMYNAWFMNFAPSAFRTTRVQTTKDVEAALAATGNLTDIKPNLLRQHPGVLPTLRMATCPPIAVDRLIGLAKVNPNLVKSMEKFGKLPDRMHSATLTTELQKIADIIEKMADPDIFVWLARGNAPSKEEVHRAATIVADRLCGAKANPIIRNAQEQRQLEKIKTWLEARGYSEIKTGDGTKFDTMNPGTFSFRMNVPIKLHGGLQSINIPVDAVVMPLNRAKGLLPVFIEAKSAGDFTNTNKRRKEEAVKMSQLRAAYGKNVEFNLFLCGYFDTPYLGYEASEGIDWVWEHRIDDLAGFGF